MYILSTVHIIKRETTAQAEQSIKHEAGYFTTHYYSLNCVSERVRLIGEARVRVE